VTGVRVIAIAAAVLVTAGCATGRALSRAPGDLTGTASWYGDPHHGRKTASGEVFDKTELTAAHRTLPLGTRVRVTNLDNGRSVVVRINDRGPFKRGRIIDLSQEAARQLGGIGDGVFRVRLDVLDDAAAERAAPAGPR
jgi:rare lipoprotein A